MYNFAKNDQNSWEHPLQYVVGCALKVQIAIELLYSTQYQTLDTVIFNFLVFCEANKRSSKFTQGICYFFKRIWSM